MTMSGLVAKRGAHVLQNGDIIRFGEYQVVAMVENRASVAESSGQYAAQGGGANDFSGGFTLAATSSVPVQTTAQSVEVVAAIGRAAQTDLGASLDLDDLLLSDAEIFSQPLAVNAYGQPVAPLQPAVARAYPTSVSSPARVATPTELSAALRFGQSETEASRDTARRIERLRTGGVARAGPAHGGGPRPFWS